MSSSNTYPNRHERKWQRKLARRQAAQYAAWQAADLSAAHETKLPERPPLRRARSNSEGMPTPWLAGVCSGIAVHTGRSVKTIRLSFVAGSFFFGAGLLLYLWLWMTVPLDNLSVDSTDIKKDGIPRRLLSPLARVGKDRRVQMVRGQLIIAGLSLLVFAVLIYVSQTWWGDSWPIILAVASTIGGAVLVWSQAKNLNDLRSPRSISVIGSGIALVILGVVMLVARNDPTPALFRGVTIGIVMIVGVVFALGPLWFKLLTDLSASRSNEIREMERADIAAHLHDSVLQTLTLIRASADNPTRVRALSLTQERELRSWLYTGREEATESIAQALRDQVGGVETIYGVEIAVVAVGDLVPGPAELAAIAAAGEATTNAVRHGDSPVSVYLEVSPTDLEIFVKDGGPGFSLEEIPDDRHGVRDSIIGRISRVGGKATIRSGVPGVAGTEVHIKVPRTDVESKVNER